MLTPHIAGLRRSPVSFMLMSALGGSSRWLKQLALCHQCRGAKMSSWFLAQILLVRRSDPIDECTLSSNFSLKLINKGQALWHTSSKLIQSLGYPHPTSEHLLEFQLTLLLIQPPANALGKAADHDPVVGSLPTWWSSVEFCTPSLERNPWMQAPSLSLSFCFSLSLHCSAIQINQNICFLTRKVKRIFINYWAFALPRTSEHSCEQNRPRSLLLRTFHSWGCVGKCVSAYIINKINEYDISPTGKQTKQSPCGAYNDIRMNTGQVQSMPRLPGIRDFRLWFVFLWRWEALWVITQKAVRRQLQMRARDSKLCSIGVRWKAAEKQV